MKTNHITFALAIALTLGSWADISAADKSGLKDSDVNFIKQAGAAGTAEVKLATLGTQKAERADVRDLAKMLVTDHTAVNAELTTLAQTKGVELSAVIDPKAAENFQDLEKESGKDFDKAFLSQLEKSHKTSISAFEDAEKNAEDGDVKAFARKTLPSLKAHLTQVKDLESK